MNEITHTEAYPGDICAPWNPIFEKPPRLNEYGILDSGLGAL
jgi:hypothetical protein